MYYRAANFMLYIHVLNVIDSATATAVYMEYVLSARDLPKTDVYDPDAYCVIQIRVNGGAWEKDGQTGVEDRTANPAWPNRFEVAYTTNTGEVKELLLKIYDKDYQIDDYLGEYVFKVTDLANINGNKVTTTFVSTKRELYGSKPGRGQPKPTVTIQHRIYSLDGANRAPEPQTTSLARRQAFRNLPTHLAILYNILPFVPVSLGYFSRQS